MFVILSITKLLSILPVILVDDNIKELPVVTKKLALLVDDEICILKGADPTLVNLPYLKLPVEKVPAPGLAAKFAIPVLEPEGKLILLLSA
jgi:hypothetical protein